MKQPSAFSPHLPPAMAHPGPSSNHWGGQSVAPNKNSKSLKIGELIQTLGWGKEFHLNPASGKPTTIRRRGAPSGGGCYPIQWHVACGEGFDLPAGHHVLSPVTGLFICRESASKKNVLAPCQARVTLTALPRRTAARYHHRSAPVIIGDAAYAAELFCAGALGLGLSTELSTSSAFLLARSAALPPPQQWQRIWPATATEIALLAIDVAPTKNKLLGIFEHLSRFDTALHLSKGPLPMSSMFPEPSWVPGTIELGVEHSRPAPEGAQIPLTLTQIRQRRSPAPSQLINKETPNTDHPLGPWCSEQNWIDYCENVILYYADSEPESQWEIHHQAAQDLVKLLSNSIQSRPISGWTHGGPYGKISHALVHTNPSREHISYDC